MVTACTAVAELLAARIELSDIIMLYLAGVAWIAMRERLAVSLATVAGSIFLYDLLYVPPRWGLNPIDKAHVITIGVMLAVGLLISRLAAQAREQRLLAEARARRAQALADLSGGLTMALTRVSIEEAVVAAVRHTTGHDASLLPAPSGDAPAQPSWPVQGLSGDLGLLVVQADASELGAEERDLLAAFAQQTALALERCASEERTTAAQLEAESERLRSTLLSGISHDFRTPLTTIVGAATSLLEQADRLEPGRRLALVRSVRDEAQRLHRLVSDLLDLTRLEEGAVQLACEWCPADDLAQEALAVLGDRLRTHSIEIEASPEVIVWCDPRLVEQALVNLLDNALRYTPPGTTVRVRMEAGNGECRLLVADEGPGLPPGGEKQVFRKFHRGQTEPSGSGSGSGTGLGLAICAAVARLHGGRIEARGAPGARFTLVLPQPARPVSLEAIG